MSKVKRFRELLPTLDEWDDFLLAELGLPGQHGNLLERRAAAAALCEWWKWGYLLKVNEEGRVFPAKSNY